jgi:hypothetical protein
MDNHMKRPVVTEIDMTVDGQFLPPPGGAAAPLASRLLRAAVVLGVLATLVAVVALTLWVALALIPIAIGIGLVAYLALRFQLWRSGALHRGPGGPFGR